MNFNKFINSDYLKSNPLCGIGTYKDELNLASGECTRNIKKKVFNGSENWTLYNGNFFSGVTDGDSKESRSVVCSHIVSPDGIIVGSGSVRLKVIKSKLPSSINTTDDLKDWITEQYNNNTPFTVWYILATPTTETIAAPSGLSGTEEGYLNQSGTPTPTNPIYPTANTVEKWFDINHYIMGTSTDTITTLPAVLYPNAVTATVGLKGDMSQTGTPTPTTPIQPQECGDLETTGEHTGQYKIPILNNSQTTNIYLGEVQSTRRIKKLVFDGTEGWKSSQSDDKRFFFITLAESDYIILDGGIVCSHFAQVVISGNNTDIGIGQGGTSQIRIRPENSGSQSGSDFASYLQQQYSAGTPVCVWYALATPTTGILNEPLRKIGDYADEVSGITLPTIAGTNTLSIGTTLQPSEVTATYKGWHPVADVHEYDSNYTIATMQTLTIAQLQTHTISELQGGEWS